MTLRAVLSLMPKARPILLVQPLATSCNTESGKAIRTPAMRSVSREAMSAGKYRRTTSLIASSSHGGASLR